MAQHLRIQHLIGKRALNNTWIIEPPPVGSVHEQLSNAQQSNLTCRVRIRPSITAPDANISSEVQTIAGRCIDEIRSKGTCRVTIQPGRLDKASRRHINPNVQTFEADRIYEVSAPVAFRLLNAKPYLYVFEEVQEQGDAPITQLAKPAAASELAEAQETIRHLADRLRALEAAAEAKPKKQRTLKDTLASNDKADSEEG